MEAMDGVVGVELCAPKAGSLAQCLIGHREASRIPIPQFWRHRNPGSACHPCREIRVRRRPCVEVVTGNGSTGNRREKSGNNWGTIKFPSISFERATFLWPKTAL